MEVVMMGARFRGVVKDGLIEVANPTLAHHFQRFTSDVVQIAHCALARSVFANDSWRVPDCGHVLGAGLVGRHCGPIGTACFVAATRICRAAGLCDGDCIFVAEAVFSFERARVGCLWFCGSGLLGQCCHAAATSPST